MIIAKVRERVPWQRILFYEYRMRVGLGCIINEINVIRVRTVASQNKSETANYKWNLNRMDEPVLGIDSSVWLSRGGRIQ